MQAPCVSLALPTDLRPRALAWPPAVSIILPTRGRPQALARSIDSLRQTAVSDSFEILLRVDEDDAETIDRFVGPRCCRAWVGERYGYRGLHRYVNELCEIAFGEWLFLWNDDALMQTKGWDEIIARYTSRFLLLNPDSNHHNHASGNSIFPIIPRAWFERLGHCSLSNHNNTWVELVAQRLGIFEDVPIQILHDRCDLTGGNDDLTAHQREFTTSEFFGPAVQAGIARDAQNLALLAVQSKFGETG
jgi:hypothetical protein